jgi:hypothetical protein
MRCTTAAADAGFSRRLGAGPLPAQGCQFAVRAGGVQKAGPTDATCSAGHEQQTKACLGDAMLDAQCFATTPVVTGRHSFQLNPVIMESWGAAGRGLGAGVWHGPVVVQQLLAQFPRQYLQEALGAGAGPASEQSLQLDRTELQLCCQLLQRRLLPQVCVQIVDGLSDTVIVGHGVALPNAA